MRLYLLLGILLVSQAWAKPKEAEVTDEENEHTEEQEIDEREQQQEEEEEEMAEAGYEQPRQDPCYDHRCPIGKECDLDENDSPVCVCVHSCPTEEEDRLKVCSTTNVTFASECELHRQKCMCHQQREGCENVEYRHVHMDYYGPCIEMTPCTEEEMTDFPIRMRDWLFLVMEELADRKDLPKAAMKMAKKAERQAKRWVLPAIWKFCDLDRTHDLYVDPHELMPITAPLKAMEHCTGPFLEKCDADNDGHIDPKEWSNCLGLDEEDQEDNMEELCESLRNFS